MSVAPLDHEDDVRDFPVTDEQYVAALEVQRLGRARKLRIVPPHPDPEDEELDLMVVPVEQARQSVLLGYLALMLLEHVLRSTRGKAAIGSILNAAWPWTENLPAPALIKMVDELDEILLSKVDNRQREAAATQLLIEWEHTAEIYADPELRESLTGPLTLAGPIVQCPGDEAGSDR